MAESQTGNQEVLNAILEYQVKNRAFKVRILPPEQFASGKCVLIIGLFLCLHPE